MISVPENNEKGLEGLSPAELEREIDDLREMADSDDRIAEIGDVSLRFLNELSEEEKDEE